MEIPLPRKGQRQSKNQGAGKDALIYPLTPKLPDGNDAEQAMNLNLIIPGLIYLAIIFFHLTALVSMYYFLFAQEKVD